MSTTECSICNKEITNGDVRNAEPVNEGFCCKECDELWVIPVRIRAALGE